ATENWLKQRTPLKRAALADEIAEAAAYLASPRSAIVTGETLTLDGGRRQLGGVLET
ncbi:MAG: SDR family oxidoreductase, partial [Pseudomonadota bacterium]